MLNFHGNINEDYIKTLETIKSKENTLKVQNECSKKITLNTLPIERKLTQSTIGKNNSKFGDIKENLCKEVLDWDASEFDDEDY